MLLKACALFENVLSLLADRYVDVDEVGGRWTDSQVGKREGEIKAGAKILTKVAEGEEHE